MAGEEEGVGVNHESKKRPQPPLLARASTCRPSASVWESGRRRYLSNILGPTTVSRSDPRPATCSFGPKICSLKPRQDFPETFLERSGAQHTLLMPTWAHRWLTDRTRTSLLLSPGPQPLRKSAIQ